MNDNNNVEAIVVLIFVLIMVLLYALPCHYANKNNCSQCAFTRDVITCVEVCKANRK